LNERNVFLTLLPAARAYLAEKGYDKTFGARPMARLIQKEIKEPLANEILFGRLQNGGKVKIDVVGDQVKFEIEESRGKKESVETGEPVSQ
jgi:ATP-dependent Clp protease ATP-binding subunit ClpA